MSPLDQQLLEDYIKGKKFHEAAELLIERLSQSSGYAADNIFKVLIKISQMYSIYTNQSIYNIYLENKSKLKEHDLFNIIIWLTPIKLERTRLQEDYAGNTEMVTDFYDSKEPLGNVFIEIPKPHVPDANSYIGLSFSDIDTTIYQFTIVDKDISEGLKNIKEDSLKIEELQTGITIELMRVYNFYEHPLFFVRNKFPILGNTLGHILDISPEEENGIFVQISIPGIHHPEFRFEKKDNKDVVLNNDLSKDQALYGKEFLPSKTNAVSVLRRCLSTVNSATFSFKPENITVDSFSFFRIVSRSIRLDKILYERSYFFTSAYLYNYYTYNYLNTLTSYGVFDSSFLTRFSSFAINNNLDLQRFIIFLIEDVIYNTIRYKSGYQYMWRDEKSETEPKSEPEVQAYLLNLIQSICELKGVNVSREVATAGVDMLFSYNTSEGRVFKLCLELKNAHHEHVAKAIGTQLKAYLDAERTKVGIYLILWYNYSDGKRFSKPSKYKSTTDLQKSIDMNSPADYNIVTNIIDCTKPKSPSRLKNIA
jgi:hypothetical protein